MNKHTCPGINTHTHIHTLHSSIYRNGAWEKAGCESRATRSREKCQAPGGGQFHSSGTDGLGQILKHELTPPGAWALYPIPSLFSPQAHQELGLWHQ